MGVLFIMVLLATLGLTATQISKQQANSISSVTVGILKDLSVHRTETTILEDYLNNDLPPLVHQIAMTYPVGCHTTYIMEGMPSNRLFNSLWRGLENTGGIILDLRLTSLGLTDDVLNDLRRSEDRFNCRAFLFDLTDSDNTSQALWFLQKLQLFLIQNAFVIFLGQRKHLRETLHDDSLRNTPNTLYLVVPSLEEMVSNLGHPSKGPPASVAIYTRCLFCNGGYDGIQLVDKWNPKSGYASGQLSFRDQFRDMNGHQFKIVILDWLPFVDFSRDTYEASTTVTPKDSVDIRMVDVIAQKLNFTYEMRVPWDDQWGTSTQSGNWTGIIGTLQHHMADFSFAIRWLWGRRQVVDFTRIYASEPMVLVMSKPRPLPPYLALVRPLESNVWATVFLSSCGAGVILWALQQCWAWASSISGMGLEDSIFTVWSIFFLEPPKNIPNNISGQMFIGWWWVYCTIITVVYKSSLVAHLSVPGLSRAVDSFEDLVGMDGWTWGIEPTYGASWEWLKLNDNPTIMKIFQSIEVHEFKDQMDRVLTGQHVLLTWKYKIQSLVAAYTRQFGYAPIYTGRAEYQGLGGYGWAFRKNAPFLPAIDMVKQHLLEAGLVSHWMDDMIGRVAAKDSSEGEEEDMKDAQSAKLLKDAIEEETSGQVVLSLHHLQSVFYVLMAGIKIAFIVLMVENFFFICKENY